MDAECHVEGRSAGGEVITRQPQGDAGEDAVGARPLTDDLDAARCRRGAADPDRAARRCGLDRGGRSQHRDDEEEASQTGSRATEGHRRIVAAVD